MTVFEKVAVAAVVGFFAVLASSKSDKQIWFEQSSRQNGCVANQRSLDKVIAVYESANAELPSGEPLEVSFDVRGRVVAASPALAKIRINGGVAPFAAGSDHFAKLYRDPTVWECPSRRSERGSPPSERSADVDYRWVATTGKLRGMVCAHYAQAGPGDEGKGYPHRADAPTVLIKK